MSKWDNDNDWFFDKFDRDSKKMFRSFGLWAVVVFFLNLLFWLAIIAAVVIGIKVLM